MSGVTQVSNLGAPLLEGTAPTLRPPARVRARSSVVDEAARITAVYEQTIQALRDMLATIKGDSASLKQDTDVRRESYKALLQTTDVAIGAQGDTIASLTERVSELSGNLVALQDATKPIIDYRVPPPVTHVVVHHEYVWIGDRIACGQGSD
ncbi:MAG: hypothetical protein NTX49_10195 [Chlamydiae bacterium]|nr:hypothetical protein [Chlamydiota bacterium]